MDVKIFSKSGIIPSKGTDGSAGYDLCAYIKEDMLIKPLERVLVPTGLFVSFEKEYEMQIRARSGLAYKCGLTMANGVGTIDSDYRGEILVLLINLSNEEQRIKNGDRIAQAVFTKVENVNFIEDENHSETKRGEGGFGSTGVGKSKF